MGPSILASYRPRGTLAGMDKQLARRRARIALSVFCGVAFILIQLLLPRSLDWTDQWALPKSAAASGTLVLTSAQGLVAQYTNQPLPTGLTSVSMRDWNVKHGFAASHRQIRDWIYPGAFIAVPYWFLSLVVIVAAVLPWWRPTVPAWRPRFSLRTMLIATILVAVVLGLGVWMAR
jgi:hypothetical protein